jgi:hypothetical protein
LKKDDKECFGNRTSDIGTCHANAHTKGADAEGSMSNKVSAKQLRNLHGTKIHIFVGKK